MAGLNLGISGGIRAGAPSGSPATMSEVAYGTGSSPTSSGGVETWHLQVGTAVAGLLWLAFLRWSLPKGGR